MYSRGVTTIHTFMTHKEEQNTSAELSSTLPSYVFFGTSDFSIHTLDTLVKGGYKPRVLVTVPDKPAGRKLILTPPPIKVWAEQNSIPCLQFNKLDQQAVEELERVNADIFIVASYGKIIPQRVLDIPKHGCLNIHPSLLPLLRGATPLQTSILKDMQDTGVTIIKMDAEMDHGPIVATHKEKITPWPLLYTELEHYLAEKGAELLLSVLPGYVSGDVAPLEQQHEHATYTKKIEKEDGLISLDMLTGEKAWNTFLTYNALYQWPGLYFFVEKNTPEGVQKIRVKIKEAAWNTALSSIELLKVVPEGKKEMTWKDFQNYISS